MQTRSSSQTRVPKDRVVEVDPAPTHLAQREQDPLEPSGGLVKPLFQRFIKLNIQLASLAALPALAVHHVIPDLFQQDPFEKDLHLGGFQVGYKDLGARVRRVRGPCGGLGEGEELGPVWQGRENLQRSRERSRLVSREQDADPVRTCEWNVGKDVRGV